MNDLTLEFTGQGRCIGMFYRDKEIEKRSLETKSSVERVFFFDVYSENPCNPKLKLRSEQWFNLNNRFEISIESLSKNQKTEAITSVFDSMSTR